MTALPRIRLDRTRLAAPQVLEKLRGAILSLELVPGTVLVRQELA
ncbi:MAG: GntR family transcriptional regulator, partial [Variovorax paradoxus]|nr:GntR family transcriptional regulator [Variovorax paradoxus]